MGKRKQKKSFAAKGLGPETQRSRGKQKKYGITNCMNKEENILSHGEHGGKKRTESIKILWAPVRSPKSGTILYDPTSAGYTSRRYWGIKNQEDELTRQLTEERDLG